MWQNKPIEKCTADTALSLFFIFDYPASKYVLCRLQPPSWYCWLETWPAPYNGGASMVVADGQTSTLCLVTDNHHDDAEQPAQINEP